MASLRNRIAMAAMPLADRGDWTAVLKNTEGLIDPDKLAELRKTEVDLLKVFNGLPTKLKSSQEGAGQAMLDNTMVLLTSNMRDGNTHRGYDLPAILAGGGFKHGQHLAFNPKLLETLVESKAPEVTRRPQIGANQAPLCNLFLSLLQRGGVEKDRFGSSKGTLTGLEFA